MKKFILFIAVFFSLQANAQYSPYSNPYYYNPYIHDRQAIEQAAEAGRRARAQAEQEARQNPDYIWSKVVENLGLGYYTKAADLANHLADNLHDGRGYWMFGMLCEMGIGVPKSIKDANLSYKYGMNISGSKSCRAEYERMRRGEYHTQKDAQAFKAYYAKLVHDVNQMTNAIFGDPFSSSNRSSSKSSNSYNKKKSGVCSNCNGTGVDPSPSSGGDLSWWKKYYNTRGNKCPYCGKYNDHWHINCPSCNVPRY